MSVPILPIVEKVGACILRRAPEGGWRMLVFRHLELPQVEKQIPGGGIEVGQGETPEAAVHRETLEEAGLAGLKLVRKIGIFEWDWPGHGVRVRRHVFVLEAPTETPDEWTHSVTGGGGDAGCTSPMNGRERRRRFHSAAKRSPI